MPEKLLGERPSPLLPEFELNYFGACAGAGAGDGREEIDLRRGRDFFLVVDREVGLFLVAENRCGDVFRECPDSYVVVLHRLDIAIARHRDAIFRAFKLRDEIAEQRIGFKLRVVFRHHQQTRQSTRQFRLGGLKLLHRGGVVGDLRTYLHRSYF